MATTGPIIVDLKASTRWARLAAWMLHPLVWVGLLSADRVVALAMRFVRIEAKVEGWGGD